MMDAFKKLSRADSIARARAEGFLLEVPDKDDPRLDQQSHMSNVVVVAGKVTKNRYGDIDP